MPADVGTVVAAKYLLIRLLGRGAMGEVWLSSHTSLGEKVAIKFLVDNEGPGEDDHATARKRFLFEAQSAAKLSRRTRHIVRVTDHGEDGDLTYLVMELLDGESLDDFIKRAGPQPVAFAADVLNQTARGLSQAHADGVFHRDLKPANLFLARDEDDRRLVKILDFGLARAHGAPRSTDRGIVLGSPSYMSPEQARGLANLDYRCDVWALAVVAYKMLTGELPFGSVSAEDALARIVMSDFTPARDFVRDLPGEIDAFFARAFAKRIDDRFESATKLAAAFEKLARTDDPAQAPAATHAAPTTSPAPMPDFSPSHAPAPPPAQTLDTVPAPPPSMRSHAPPEPERHDSDGIHSGATTSQTGEMRVQGLPRPLGTRLLFGGLVAVAAVLVVVFAARLRSRSAPTSTEEPAVPASSASITPAPAASSSPASSASVAPAPPPATTTSSSTSTSTEASATAKPGATASIPARPNGRAAPSRSPPTTTATAPGTATTTTTPTKRGNQDEVF